MKHDFRREWRRLAGSMLVAASLSLSAWSDGALAQQDGVAALAGHWVADDGQDGLPLREITIEPAGRGVAIDKVLTAGGRDRGEYEPSSGSAFLIEEDSSNNPLEGTPSEWIRIGEDSLHLHRLEATDSGGLMIVTEEFQLSPSGDGTVEYKRRVFRDGVQQEAVAGILTKGG